MADGLSLAETVAVITTEYAADEERVQADVIAFAEDLVERGLLEAE